MTEDIEERLKEIERTISHGLVRFDRDTVAWLISELRSARKDAERIEGELFTMRRWASDAGVALALALAHRDSPETRGRVRMNVERIYRRLAKLTDERPRPAKSESSPIPSSTQEEQ